MRLEEGKAFGVHEALSWIKQRAMLDVEIQSDSRLVVDAISSNEKDDYEFGGIVDSCRRALRSCPSYHVCYASRKANVVANKISRSIKFFISTYV